MTNAKRNTKSIIALVVMSLLLVASILLAATGAWFTDKVADKTGTVNFGKINIEYSTTTPFSFAIKDTEGTIVMPGDTLQFAGVIENKEEAAYVAIGVSFTGVESLTATKKVVQVAKGGTIDLSTELDDIVLTGENYKNNYQGKPISVTVTVCAVQAKNITLTGSDEAAKYDEVVAYVTANSDIQGPQA